MAIERELDALVGHLQRQVARLESVLRADSSLEYLRVVFDDLFEGLQILDHEWRYLYLNKAAFRHARRPVSDLLGRRIMDVYPGIESSEIFRVMAQSMEEGTPKRIINCFSYPDGQSAWFDLRINPVPMGILVLSVDISDERANQEQLRRSREDLATTLECMSEAVITTDLEGRVRSMNPAAEQLTGWSAEECRGRGLDELVQFVNGRTRERVDHPVDIVLRRGLKIGLANDTVLVTREGRGVPIASSGAPIRDGEGAIRGVVMVLRDMTEEYDLANMLQHAQKMEAIGRLACGVAHDFNNLLTVILGYSELLLADSPDEQARPLEQIRAAAQRASGLTRQLLAFSRKQVLQPQTVNLNEVVGAMDTMLRCLIGEDIDLVTRLAPKLHPVMIDRGQMEQIIMNLAVNARDAMPSGGKLTIETANVELDRDYADWHADVRPGPHVMVAITDTGVGMDSATMSKIFEPFFTTKPAGKGTGLGLSTVYGIVKQSGGNVWVYSEPGRGTSFKIYLPKAKEASTAPAAPPPVVVPTSGHETILVVEDDEPVRELICKALRDGGYPVIDTGDADEAIRICREHAGEIHVLLTDLILPKKSGRELVWSVQEIRPSLRVMFMSGYSEQAIVHQGMMEAAAAFIEKPIAPSQLLKRIREFLSTVPRRAT
jgi:PAS domain S-box-containing protein